MKFKIEKNLKIVSELITFFHNHGSSDVNINLNSDDEHSYFNISGKVKPISEEELSSLINMLNSPRQHEIEQYYWNLGGESEYDSELILIGMMINTANVTYKDDILTIKLIRNEQ